MSQVRNVLGGISLALFLFLILENFARVALDLRDDFKKSDHDWYVASPVLGWERRPNFRGKVGSYFREFDRQGFLAADTPKLSSHNPKVLILGDSTTFGWGVPAASCFPQILNDALSKIDVINLGVIGYSSYQGYQALLKSCRAIHPSVIIASFNYNDRRYVFGPDAVDGDKRFDQQARVHRIKTITERIRLYRLMAALFLEAGLLQVPEVVIDDARKLPTRVSPESYRENLVAMSRLAEQEHIPLILMVLNDNPIQTEHLRRGISMLDRSHLPTAIQELTIASDQGNTFSYIARKYLAFAYEKNGHPEEAKRVSRVLAPFASAFGGHPIHLDAEYNEVMRSVAREYHTRLVEAGRALGQDPSKYLDWCHPNERGHETIARMLKPVIIQALKQKIGSKDRAALSSVPAEKSGADLPVASTNLLTSSAGSGRADVRRLRM